MRRHWATIAIQAFPRGRMMRVGWARYGMPATHAAYMETTERPISDSSAGLSLDLRFRWRLSAGLSASDAAQGIRAIRRFSAFLAGHALAGEEPASIGRPLLERYLADLSSSGLSPASC